MPLEEGDTFFFAPRTLRNLLMVDELDSLSPILACQVADLGEEPERWQRESQRASKNVVWFQPMRTRRSCTCSVVEARGRLFVSSATDWKSQRWQCPSYPEIPTPSGRSRGEPTVRSLSLCLRLKVRTEFVAAGMPSERTWEPQR